MKITIHLIVSLILVVALAVFAFSLYQVSSEKDRLAGDLERRSLVFAESLQESIAPLIESNSIIRLNRIVNKFGNRERLKGIAVFDTEGNILTSTQTLNLNMAKPFTQAIDSVIENRFIGNFLTIDEGRIYACTIPIRGEDDRITGALATFNNVSYIDIRLKEIWKLNIIRFLTLSTLVVFSTIIVVKWSITGPIARLAEWVRDLRTTKTETIQPAVPIRGDVLDPLIAEVTHLAKSLSIARMRAEKESRLRVHSEPLWTSQGLKAYMQAELAGKKLFLVSNREPYMHVKEGNTVKCIIPAGGVVTALDPVMRICDGIWFAHGSGDADREMVDSHSTVRVPPQDPAYTLRRIWLTKEEEDGYYYGFSNEGLWPLCHITHTRPEFRLEDWVCYQKVNELFAEALLEEIIGEESPLILIQDYQLALLPFLVKQKRPDAKVALFWHIPWPNPESFGICPWRQEILIGMLGADLLSFHIQFFCNNFLDSVDRFLESQIDWEQFAIHRGGHTTSVKPFPISVSYDNGRDSDDTQNADSETKESILKEIGVQSQFIGVGVDRIDYTKGIPERFRAIERFLEKYPQFIEKFTFVELGAPSRSHIRKYRELMAEVEEMVERVNWRFQTKKWKPIIFRKANHSHAEINRYYKIADICMVTSLHDGMNLVAKEFIMSRPDGDGVLILSQFAGASRELKDAIVINPYDIEEMADAIK
ncbi:MAG: alpha,alpha-trehalose-phosphate synthase, partial [Deltaproteobacteria bacterium]|nr:alpha,alpha-trehalose-phosphate synthase [Deltaproteobacteria bacterium]